MDNVARILEPLPGFIELTYEPCMITLDDDPRTARAKMPCGHVISKHSKLHRIKLCLMISNDTYRLLALLYYFVETIFDSSIWSKSCLNLILPLVQCLSLL